MKQGNGGPAFPTVSGESNVAGGILQSEGGMTLRDYFAGQVLTGVCSNVQALEYPARVARDCYAMADALIAEKRRNS